MNPEGTRIAMIMIMQLLVLSLPLLGFVYWLRSAGRCPKCSSVRTQWEQHYSPDASHGESVIHSSTYACCGRCSHHWGHVKKINGSAVTLDR